MNSTIRPQYKDVVKACLINNKMQNKIDACAQDLADSREFISDLVSGVHRSALVYGSPGMGKTHLITDGLNRADKQIGEDYLIARSHTTPSQFFAMLYLMRDAGKFIVMDDCDGLMANETGLNLLKAATDGTFRQIGWNSPSAVKIPGTDIIVPNNFEFNGSVVIATNIRGAQTGKTAQHQAAIKSRCVSWKMNYDSKEEQFAYVFHMIVNEDYLDSQADTQITWAQKIDLLKFIQTNLSICPALDLRKPQHIARVIKTKTNWQNHARRFLETQ
jgi:hypothetical protein